MCCACNNQHPETCELLLLTRTLVQCELIKTYHADRDLDDDECPDAAGSSHQWIRSFAKAFDAQWKNVVVHHIHNHKYFESEKAHSDIGLHPTLDDYFPRYAQDMLPQYLEARRRFGRDHG